MKDEDIKKFWIDYEARVGEKVVAKELAEYLSGMEGIPPDLWGLLVATESALRFDHNAPNSWLRQLFGGKDREGTSYSFVIPREEIASIRGEMEKNFLKRVFLPIKDGILVETAPPGGEKKCIFFLLDRGRITKFVEAARTAFGL